MSEAFRWYEARNAGLGRDYLRAVAVALAAMQRALEQYSIAAEDVRRLLLRRFSYVVYFVIRPADCQSSR